MTQNTITVALEHSPTELYKILKFEGLVSSGAEAKIVIAEGQVQLNGDIERQKRKKIVAGDIVDFDNNRLIITLA
ncbi:MAG: RNA-binding S4 domain-containing protein [Gammaproteobacteria bacterium]|nr:RNA-binding S4 domain-containing protein [Gammaproteobacteria bacterium]MDT8371738.1 RNA-binding S4 domain-containing protein [Gammaproteobacteria bacterium]